jgi:uncharacterized Zn finger protein (UPF0148 family)
MTNIQHEAPTGKVKCPVCGQEFNTEEEHEKHHREAHPEDES